jgi:hypothetical protein
MRPVREADNLLPYCAIVTESGGFNLLEPCGPVQACNGTASTKPYLVNLLSSIEVHNNESAECLKEYDYVHTL